MSNHSEISTETNKKQLPESAGEESCLVEGAAAIIADSNSLPPLTPNPGEAQTEAMASRDTSASGPLSNINKDSQMLDSLMQRMRSDLMYELRHLQHGDRPVTGQGHRDSLHQFMLKHCDSEGQNNVTANRDAVEEHRPEAVVVEVQGMIERRPVSSVLQSPAFRRQLENVIRGGLVSASHSRRTPVTTAPTPSAASRQPRQPVHAARRNPRPGALEVAPTESSSLPTEEDIPVPLSRSESRESLDSFSSARSSAEQELDEINFEDEHDAESPDNVIEPMISAPQEQNLSTNHVESHPEPLRHTSILTGASPALEESPRVEMTWSDISQVHREEMVQELSELLHSRLVSTTLDSEFRATLELLAQEHVQSTGVNGRAVQDFIHTLPGRGIPRNDFSHLGIPAGAAGGDENWDNLSVTSVSAHSVPYVQTNTYLGREIQSLRAQMNEMKSMLKLTFDLQMDIQRSIRQEVAAALNTFTGASVASAPGASASRPVNDTHCLICLDRHSDSVLYQCGHMCVCYMCGRDLVSRGHSCPVCRAPIKDVIRAYKTNAE